VSEGFIVPHWFQVTEEELEAQRLEMEAKLNRFIEGVSKLPVNADGTVSIPIVREAE